MTLKPQPLLKNRRETWSCFGPKPDSRFGPKHDSCFGPKRDSTFGSKRDSCFGAKREPKSKNFQNVNLDIKKFFGLNILPARFWNLFLPGFDKPRQVLLVIYIGNSPASTKPRWEPNKIVGKILIYVEGFWFTFQQDFDSRFGPKHESRFDPKVESRFGPKHESGFDPKREPGFGPKQDHVSERFLQPFGGVGLIWGWVWSSVNFLYAMCKK